MSSHPSPLRVVDPAQAAAEHVASQRRPTLAERWGDGLLMSTLDDTKPLVKLEDAGLGKWFDDVLGGGVQVGEILSVGAAGAGVGKTALVHQVADGWAKHSARALEAHAGADAGRPRVTPVVYVTEMSARSLTVRTLAREAGVPGKYLRAPLHYGQAGSDALREAFKASAAFSSAAKFITPIDSAHPLGWGTDGKPTRDPDPIAELREILRAVYVEWSKAADVTAVVLVVDPLHRLLPAGVDETGALGDLLPQLLRLTQGQDIPVVTLFTSDTTKAAAGNRNGGNASVDDKAARDHERDAEQAYRGNYQLIHMPDHVLSVEALKEGDVPAELLRLYRDRAGGTLPSWATTFAHLPTPKLRWGQAGDRPSFWYDKALFRFTPIPRPGDPTPKAPNAVHVESSWLTGKGE